MFPVHGARCMLQVCKHICDAALPGRDANSQPGSTLMFLMLQVRRPAGGARQHGATNKVAEGPWASCQTVRMRAKPHPASSYMSSGPLSPLAAGRQPAWWGGPRAPTHAKCEWLVSWVPRLAESAATRACTYDHACCPSAPGGQGQGHMPVSEARHLLCPWHCCAAWASLWHAAALNPMRHVRQAQQANLCLLP